jgi:hypothetical protein
MMATLNVSSDNFVSIFNPPCSCVSRLAALEIIPAAAAGINEPPLRSLRLMNCEKTRELLHAYIDGELDLLRHAQIERHLGECEACRLEHQELLKLRSLIETEAQRFAAPNILKQRVKRLYFSLFVCTVFAVDLWQLAMQF